MCSTMASEGASHALAGSKLVSAMVYTPRSVLLTSAACPAGSTMDNRTTSRQRLRKNAPVGTRQPAGATMIAYAAPGLDRHHDGNETPLGRQSACCRLRR